LAPAGTFTQVATGSVHSCGVKTDGTLACWGNNGNGQATAPAGTFTQVAGGWAHSCGLKTDGTFACWGSNSAGQATPPDLTPPQSVQLYFPDSQINDPTPMYGGTASSASGDDADVTIKVYEGPDDTGTLIGTHTAAIQPANENGFFYTQSADEPLADGTYTVVATQSDSAGNSTSATLTFTVNTVAPDQPTVVEPTGTKTPDATPLVSGQAEVGDDTESFVTANVYEGSSVAEGTFVQTFTASIDQDAGPTQGRYSASVPDPLDDYATYTIVVTHSDTSGNSTDSAEKVVTVDLTSPSLTIDSPSADQQTSDTTPVVSGSAGTAAGDDASVSVKVFQGPTQVGSTQTPAVTSGSHSTSLDELPVGSYTVEVGQSDSAGNSTTKTVSFSVVAASTSDPDPAPGPGDDGVACANALTGTAAGERIAGSAEGDLIRGMEGDDKLLGLAGIDCVYGNGGDDWLWGGKDADEVYGHDGSDRLWGGGGDDHLSGGAGDDGLRGGRGSDRLDAGADDDWLWGGRGADRMNGGGGTNHYFGRRGDDRIKAANGIAETVRCGRGDDVVIVDRVDETFRCESVERR
jgi:Ca2+-binding RTX toxin-like protein